MNEARQRVLGAWLLLGIGWLALFLRLYRLEVMGWAPDTYERLFDAQAMLSGSAPDSVLYPPGASLLLVPFFAFLPDTLATMQAVTVAAGLLLVVVAHRWMLDLTGDRRAALLIGVVAAACPSFVFSSRDALYDTQNLLLIVLSLMYASRVRTMPLASLALYGLLVALLLNVRPNNVLVLPAIALIYLETEDIRRLGDVMKAVTKPRVLIVGAVTFALCAGMVVFANWTSNSSSAPFTFEPFLENLTYYAYSLSFGAIGLVLVVPAAVVGARHLWRSKRHHVVAIMYLIAVWPLSYAPFDFTSFRYILPALFLMFFLAAIGFSTLLTQLDRRIPSKRWLSRYAALSLVLLGAFFTAGSVKMLIDWPQTVRESDHGLATEFHPAVRAMDGGSLLVSAVSRPLRQSASHLQFYDLVDSTLAHGSSEDGAGAMAAAMEHTLVNGGRVYYLYSHWEQGEDFRGTGEERYDLYWRRVIESYSVTPLQESESERLTGERWTLYEVSAKRAASPP